MGSVRASEQERGTVRENARKKARGRGPRVDRRACRSQPSPCYGCFLPDLTGFTGSRTRTGPCGQHSALAAPSTDGTRRDPEFQTAPRAPARIALPARSVVLLGCRAFLGARGWYDPRAGGIS